MCTSKTLALTIRVVVVFLPVNKLYTTHNIHTSLILLMRSPTSYNNKMDSLQSIEGNYILKPFVNECSFVIKIIMECPDFQFADSAHFSVQLGVSSSGVRFGIKGATINNVIISKKFVD